MRCHARKNQISRPYTSITTTLLTDWGLDARLDTEQTADYISSRLRGVLTHSFEVTPNIATEDN